MILEKAIRMRGSHYMYHWMLYIPPRNHQNQKWISRKYRSRYVLSFLSSSSTAPFFKVLSFSFRLERHLRPQRRFVKDRPSRSLNPDNATIVDPLYLHHNMYILPYIYCYLNCPQFKNQSNSVFLPHVYTCIARYIEQYVYMHTLIYMSRFTILDQPSLADGGV